MKLCDKGIKLDRSVTNSINTIEKSDEELSNLEKARMVGLNSYFDYNEVRDDPTMENHLKIMVDTRIVMITDFVHDSPVCVLVDSGASINTITKSFFKKIESKVTTVKSKETWFKIVCKGFIISNCLVQLKVEFPNISIEEMLWIIDNYSFSYNIVFNRGIQKKCRLLIDLDDNGFKD